MSNEPKIAVDVDGVLADIYSPIFKRMGLPYTWEDVREWDFFDDLHVDRQTFWDAYKKLWSEEYKLIPLVEKDAPHIIAELRRRHFEIHIMCNRPRQTVSGTVLWLRFHRIEYDKLIVFPPLTDKTKYLNDYLFLVDDNLAYACGKVILFDRPWNQCVNARRIRSLQELLDILPSLSPPQRGWRGATGLPWGPLWGSSGEGRCACGGASSRGWSSRTRPDARPASLLLSPGETETGERR